MEFIDSLPELEGGYIFDTHAHYDDEQFEPDLVSLLGDMHSYGVCGIITCACDRETAQTALRLAHEYDYIYAAIGVHPCNVDGELDESWLRAGLSDKRCVAVGEIGLDYHWNEPSELATRVFERQLELAAEYGKPVIVHDREAHADTCKLLSKHRPRGVVHCFSGSAEMAVELVKQGMYIGIGGVITFKNARKAVEVVNAVPIERILLETDAPYMAPVPLRGKRCDSSMIALTAAKIAELKALSVRDVLDITRQSTYDLFGV